MDDMEEDIHTRCSQSFYEELYHDPSGVRSIVADQVSGRICLKKTLEIYDRDVFRYLESHFSRSVPRILCDWEEDGRLVVIEELISGCTLEYLLDNDLADKEQKKDILLQICNGLMFLHGADPPIIHRDLKPSNIMVTDDGTVKIIDYDAAKVFDPVEERDTIQIGTKGSAAPEQYGFGKCDARTDVYALGVLIREMFPNDPDMRRIADRASSLSPEDRYQSVEAVRRALLRTDHRTYRIRDGEQPDRRRTCVPVPGFRSGTPWKMAAAACGYALILLCTLSFQVTSRGQPVKGVELWINRLALLGLSLSLVDLFTGWTGIFRRLTMLQSRRRAVRLIGYAAAAAGLILLWALLCVIVVDFAV